MCKSRTAETVGVERRGGYFDTAGTLRDMVPNHVMQLLSLTAMESPVSFQADAVRNEQAKVLHSIQPLSSDDVCSAACAGNMAPGCWVRKKWLPIERNRECGGIAHRDLRGPESSTSTIGAGRECLSICGLASVWRCATQRSHPVQTHAVRLFRNAPFHKLHTNTLVIQIQPVEGISLSFGAKIPGPAAAGWVGQHEF
jgi:glucose-6-phosphate 1-dehydrogenase